jgi:FK506-binding nuclear protein
MSPAPPAAVPKAAPVAVKKATAAAAPVAEPAAAATVASSAASETAPATTSAADKAAKKKAKKLEAKRKASELSAVVANKHATATADDEEEPSNAKKAKTPAAVSQALVGKSVSKTGGVKIKDLIMGSGNTPSSGRTIALNYTATLTDGHCFDKNMNHKAPFRFRMGLNQVVKGLEVGLEGMRVGGEREITIPPKMGYGAKKQAGIPANSTMIFHVVLKDVEKNDNKYR